ncbi:hypothetical protein EYF80_033841 [Liparis tanakae]|uniref:Uncharacterized protein n=1 Tax=Liparis tanakae TaxID=230148 RepID=A0A4Z2GTM3_9TELE|nr:hypothetical protein EYF80_033841 [Liparis tanakae]
MTPELIPGWGSSKVPAQTDMTRLPPGFSSQQSVLVIIHEHDGEGRQTPGETQLDLTRVERGQTSIITLGPLTGRGFTSHSSVSSSHSFPVKLAGQFVHDCDDTSNRVRHKRTLLGQYVPDLSICPDVSIKSLHLEQARSSGDVLSDCHAVGALRELRVMVICVLNVYLKPFHISPSFLAVSPMVPNVHFIYRLLFPVWTYWFNSVQQGLLLEATL